jgi:hypothetical protein
MYNAADTGLESDPLTLLQAADFRTVCWAWSLPISPLQGRLLLFIFVSSTLSALEAPAWQWTVPQLVPKKNLSGAVIANGVCVNISRAVCSARADEIIAG